MSLAEYRRKRDFTRTAEPATGRAKRGGRRFVIQKHAARRLHYDLRLELGGTLKSWAVPKGLPLRHGERHLAVHVEDHPLDYIDFEGTIPKGEYGGGTVMVWDRGHYEPLSRSPARDLAAGKLHFVLHGQKLQGEWYLVRLQEEDQWLVIRAGDDLREADDRSVASGKSMEEISTGGGLPEFVEPMKARLVEEPPKSGEWIYEIKFDGWRALARKQGKDASLVSRNNHELGGKFPDLIRATAALDANSAILDGEIVALDERGVSSFQLLQAYDLGETKPPLFYYVFDVLYLNGRDVRNRPLGERKTLVEDLLKDAPAALRFSAALGRDARPLLQKAREFGLEGLIGKRVDSIYEAARRSGAWIKLKLLAEQEFVIGGFTEPEGTRRHFGALLVGYFERGRLHFAGRVGSGYSERILEDLAGQMAPLARDKCPFVDLPAERGGRWGQGLTAADLRRCHWVEPRLVCQVRFSEWTRDGRLRQPVFVGMRKDKPAREVRRET
ncbi:MAG: non-homologous end-joining DNA ligase [Terrimicrobiaceae bacterium]|nr:non-homologous end-joining DNA ligase [Terrimicrobiaceae bacterium]